MTIKDKFKQLKKQNKKAFIAYVPFGFPSIRYTKNIILTFQGSGVDIIELGIPFSDPIADGPIIQEATTIALNKGATTEKLFSTLQEIKKSLKVPLVLMTYYNPVYKFGMERFFKNMQITGVSGIMIVDLPVEESKDYIRQARKYDLETIFFITPVTPKERAIKIIQVAGGFIYYISVTGITGPKDINYAPIATHIRKLKKMTNLPVCVGFGIHTREQVERVFGISDGAIVGSGIVKFIKENFSKKDFLQRLRNHTASICTR